MDRSAAYNFLLTFHSNHGAISYYFRDGDFSRKSQNFRTPVYFAPRMMGFPLEFGISAEGQKTTVMGLAEGERSLTISSAV